MRTLGIIGGLGPESTIEYYRLLIAGYRERILDGSYPPWLINSIDVNKMPALVAHAGRNDLRQMKSANTACSTECHTSQCSPNQRKVSPVCWSHFRRPRNFRDLPPPTLWRSKRDWVVVLNVFNLLQWCFNRLIPAQSPHFGANVSPRMAAQTRHP